MSSHCTLFTHCPVKTVFPLHATIFPVKPVVPLHASTLCRVRPIVSSPSTKLCHVTPIVALHDVHRQDRCAFRFHHTLQSVDAPLFSSRKPSLLSTSSPISHAVTVKLVVSQFFVHPLDCQAYFRSKLAARLVVKLFFTLFTVTHIVTHSVHILCTSRAIYALSIRFLCSKYAQSRFSSYRRNRCSLDNLCYVF